MYKKVNKTATSEETQKVEKIENSDIIEEKQETVADDVHYVGKIDKNIYSCVTEDIVTDEVIITDRQIEHIKEQHPNNFEEYNSYFKTIVEEPDYIIEANKPNSALILKKISHNEKEFKTVLRLITLEDNQEYKNSIITFMKIDDKEWNRLLRNKKILYKSE